ncbi:chemotaxis protein CheD [Pseudoduganella sp. LjRoot289]|uniref:chemotaxis protein CheD n=1 Tax=Pseudoduganella sp. LjRoot289 TaxID=3342314 RepID=UPI003ECE3572
MAKDTNTIDIFLLPGEYFVGGAEYRIRTLLGSCVSITLWHPERRIGTMSHFLLSARNGAKDSELNSRYGEEALELMLAELRAMGVDPAECEAKIFGGSMMFPEIEGRKSGNIGRRNGEVALRLLRVHGIPVVSESLYGVGHRSIIFDVDSGNVWSRQARPGDKTAQSGAPPAGARPMQDASLAALQQANAWDAARQPASARECCAVLT